MTTIWHDIRYGVRMLVKRPGFTAVIVLTLALGIGANTAIFSFLDRVVLRPLPVKKARELVRLEHQYQYHHDSHSWEGTTDFFNYPLYVTYRDQSQVFSRLIAYASFGNMDEPVIARQFGEKERNFMGERFSARGYAVSAVGFDEADICKYMRDHDPSGDGQGAF